MSDKVKLQPHQLRAAITPQSYDSENNTIEVVFATEAEVSRRLYSGEKVIEVLKCRPENVRLDRLNAGANLVDSHGTYTVNQVLGVVVRAWVESKECKAIIRLSKRADVAGIVQDITDGIIRNISVGYNVFQYNEDDKPDEITRYTAEDWEPCELSVVCVPADHNSGTRSKENDQYNEVTITPKRQMDPEENKPNPGGEQQQQQTAPTPEATRQQAITDERLRTKEITRLVRAAKIDDAQFLDGLIERGVTPEKASMEIINKMAESQDGVRNHQPDASVTGTEENVQVRSAIEQVILHRSAPGVFTLESDKAKEMRHASLLELAGIALRMKGVIINPGMMSKDEIAKRAMSSSDFPNLLGNVVNRSLRKYYDAAPSFWKEFSRQVTATDFKPITSVQFGGSINLEKIEEGGEYKNAVLKEAADSFALETYGKKISVTRKMLINDDMNGFMRNTEMFGRGAAEMEASEIYKLFTMNSGAGRVLGEDQKNLFHADHKNLAASGAKLSLETLNAARVAMTRQTGIKGEKISVRARYLVVPPELEILAKQLINSTIIATKTGDTNPLQGAFDIIVDAYLEDPKAWMVLADPATIDVVKYAYLSGQEGLYTEQQIDFDTDNLDIKVRTDFAATIEEFRGTYKNPGQ